MTRRLLKEELNRFRMMVNYDPSKTLTEQGLPTNDREVEMRKESGGIPKLKKIAQGVVGGEINLANLEFAGGKVPVAQFKNRGIIDVDAKNIYLFPSLLVGWSIPYVPPVKVKPPVVTPPSEVTKRKSISLTLELEDPFIINSISLDDVGRADYKQFVRDYNKMKKENLDVWPQFIEHLKNQSKKNQLYIKAYASIDGDPNEKGIANSNNKDATFYAPCRRPGGMLRREADQCLSEKRAEKMLSDIERDIPELKGIFLPKGMGQTEEFDEGKKWPKYKKTETGGNRIVKMDEIIPFTFDESIIEPSGETKIEDKPKPIEIPTLNIFDDDVNVYGPYKTQYKGKDVIFYYGTYMDAEGKSIVITGDNTKYPNRWVVKDKRDVVYPGGATDPRGAANTISEYKAAIDFLKGKKKGLWDVSESIEGTGSESVLPFFPSEDNQFILVTDKSIEDVFGSIDAFSKFVPRVGNSDFQGETNPTAKISSNGIDIIANGVTYKYKGWSPASTTSSLQDYTYVGSSESNFCMKATTKSAGVIFYKIGKCGFSLGK